MPRGSARCKILHFSYRRFPMTKVSPSILSADFGNLERDIRAMVPAKADYVHVDVMDGIFVPNNHAFFVPLHNPSQKFPK